MKIKKIALFLPAAIMIIFSVSSCAQENQWASLEKNSGEDLFVEKCGMCHRASGMGTGILARRMDADLALLENRKDLQAVYVKTVARNGFNTMFPLSRGEVSDEQLDKIATYLSAGSK